MFNSDIKNITRTENGISAPEREKLLQEMQAIRRANDAKSEFLASMSHEMRTSLNVIIGLTWLSLENEALDRETKSNLEKAYNAGTTLLGIVNDILDISKIESGKLELTPVEYSLASVISSTVTQSLPRIGDKPVEFKMEIDGDMFASLVGDELRLKQIIINLLSNSIKYTARGEVKLSVSCRRDGDAVWLTLIVSDTGQGIRKENLEKIFDEYTRMEAVANRSIEGTGLGLAITKRLCELMDGTINVESEYTKGSVFTVRLRQAFVSEKTLSDETVSSLKKLRFYEDMHNRNKSVSFLSLPNARVLVVDDNKTNLDVARGLMQPYGMQIDCVDSGQKAINAVVSGEYRYDAIFMDHMMPGMNGIEATHHIRELTSDYVKKIPIIALTANAISGSEEMYLSRGFQAFLSKPIDIQKLDEVIREWVYDAERDIISESERVRDEKPTRESAPQKTGSLLYGKTVAGIDLENEAARFGGNETIFINVLQAFAEDIRGLIKTVENVDNENIASYRITIHGIKGACYNIGANALGDAAQVLEAAAKSDDLPSIHRLNPSFLSDLKEFTSGLDELLSSVGR